MGKHIIDAFIVTLSLETAGFKSGEREISDATKRLRENNKRTFSEMENRGKSAAAAFKSVRNEVVGLGLAFMGAQSIMGLVTNMMTGASSAERLGQTMGMATEKVWAWRMAMKEINHSGGVADADAALSSIQRDKMDYRFRRMDGDRLNLYGRLGISGNDLRDADPGEILKKLARMQPKMGAQQYADHLQHLGLPASTVSLLIEGKGSIDALIKKFEEDGKGQQELADQQQKLQTALVDLESTITGALVPKLTDLVTGLNSLLSYFGVGPRPVDGKAGHGGPDLPKYTAAQVHSVTGRPVSAETLAYINAGRGGAAVGVGRSTGGAPSSGDDNIMRYFMSKGLSHDQALGIRAGIEAEGGLNQPLGGGYKGRAIGIGQWLGSRRAELIRRYGPKPTLAQQLDYLWWELSSGDQGGKSALSQRGSRETMTAYLRDFMRPQGPNNEHYRDLLADIRRGNAYIDKHRHAGAVHIGTLNVNTRATDAKGIARDIRGELRRSAVSQTDRGIAP